MNRRHLHARGGSATVEGLFAFLATCLVVLAIYTLAGLGQHLLLCHTAADQAARAAAVWLAEGEPDRAQEAAERAASGFLALAAPFDGVGDPVAAWRDRREATRSATEVILDDALTPGSLPGPAGALRVRVRWSPPGGSLLAQAAASIAPIRATAIFVVPSER